MGNNDANREILGVVSWNVACITASLLSSFLLNLTFHCPWSVLCLEEAFTKTEGLRSSSTLDGTDGQQHVIFTPKEVKRGLRAPAIIVRNTFPKKTVFLLVRDRDGLLCCSGICAEFLCHRTCLIPDSHPTFSRPHCTNLEIN